MLPRLAPAAARAGAWCAGVLLLVGEAVVLVLHDPAPVDWQMAFVLAGSLTGALLMGVGARVQWSAWVAAGVLVVLAHLGSVLGEELWPMSLAGLAVPAAGPALLLLVAIVLAPSLGTLRWAWVFLAMLVPEAFLLLQFRLMLQSPSAPGEARALVPCLLVGLPAGLAALGLRLRRAPPHATAWIAAASALALTSGLASVVGRGEFALSCALFALALAAIARVLGIRGPIAPAAACALLALLEPLLDAVGISLPGAALPGNAPTGLSSTLADWRLALLVPGALGLALVLAPADPQRGRRWRLLLGGSALVSACLWVREWLLHRP